LKPEGNPFALTFRIPHTSFHLPGLGPRLTVENLIKAVGLAPDEVESWRTDGSPTPALREPLPLPPHDAFFRQIDIQVKPPQAASESSPLQTESPTQEVPEATWEFLEERWKLILGVEASMDSLRTSMEIMRSEMETAARRTLPLEVKVNALSADVSQWTKAKSRIHYAVPKLREFIHRATWASAAAERKKLEEFFENHVQQRVPSPQIEEMMAKFEGLLKERNVLYSQGMSAYQECKSITAECEGTLRRLQSNSAANAKRKKSGDSKR
jgi:hypothetical protein